MCEWGTHKEIEINGRFWKVDACIADQVQMLISRGIKSFGCCCGHGKEFDLDPIEHHFHSELMVSAESADIAVQHGLKIGPVFEKKKWGITRNYVNVRLIPSFDDDGNY